MGREDFIPYANDEGQKRQEILSYFREHFLTKTRDEWFDYLRQWDICVSRVLTVDEMASDPQLVARQMIVEVDDPRVGKVKQAGISVKLSETPGSIRSLSPATGQHTDEVLQGLGYAREEIDRLRGAGAIR
jgi:crotonobetainyl-CoA:carnitine CoA-transferase CaiB-like acyl-CoA transferase